MVAAETHAITEALAVTLFAGALRTLKRLVGRMRAFGDAAIMSKILLLSVPMWAGAK